MELAEAMEKACELAESTAEQVVRSFFYQKELIVSKVGSN
jgi:hypothetical protein